MEGKPLLRWACLRLVAAAGVALLAAPSTMAQEGLQATAGRHIIQFNVNSGNGDFTLYVQEGTAAFVSAKDGGDRIAFVPVLVDGEFGRVDLRVFEVRAQGHAFTLGAQRKILAAQVGFSSYLVTTRLIELEPVGILTVDAEPGERPGLRKKARAELPDPSEAGVCCITSGGVTTCACAVTQGGQSCCSPPCCSFAT